MVNKSMIGTIVVVDFVLVVVGIFVNIVVVALLVVLLITLYLVVVNESYSEALKGC